MPPISVFKRKLGISGSSILKSMMHRFHPSLQFPYFSSFKFLSLILDHAWLQKMKFHNFRFSYHFFCNNSITSNRYFLFFRLGNPTKLCMLQLSGFEIHPGIIYWDTLVLKYTPA